MLFSYKKSPWIIIAIAFILTSTSLFIGIQSFKATEEATYKAFNNHQLTIASGITSGIELYFKTLSENLKALGRIPGVNQLDKTVLAREVRQYFELLKQFGVNDVGVLDSDGLLLINVKAPRIVGNNFSWRTYFQEAKNMTLTDSYTIEFIEFKGVEAGQKGIILAVPMFNREDSSPTKADFSGVVICTLKLNTLTERFIANIRPSERGHVILIDHEYNILWSPDKSEFGSNFLKESEQFPDLNAIVRKMGSGEAATGEYSYYLFDESTGKYGEDVDSGLIAFTPVMVGKNIWSIGVFAPKDVARRLIYSAFLKHQTLLGLTVFIIFLGTIYALTLSSRTGRALEREVNIKTAELKSTVAALQESEGTYRTLLENLPQKIFYKDRNSVYVSCNDSYANDLNISSGEIPGKTDFNFFPESLARKYRDDDKRIMESGKIEEIEEEYVQKGEKRTIYTVKTPVKDKNGNVTGILGIFWDITERKKNQEKIKESLHEKEILLQEIHHRVKNNMQVISSLLKLQSENIKDAQYAEMFNESRNRISSMSLIHDQLYHSESLASINFKEYINNLSRSLMPSYSINLNTISLKTDIEEIILGIDTAMPCGLIINELFSNALKHAFPDGRSGEISISLVRHTIEGEDGFHLQLSDNGVGIPEDVNIYKKKTLGMKLVTSLVEHQLQGNLQLDRSNGSRFNIYFKELKYKKRL